MSTDERELHPSEETEHKENSREYLWRVLKPGGCILVLLLTVLFLVFCFTWRNDPAEGGAETDAPAVTDTIKE